MSITRGYYRLTKAWYASVVMKDRNVCDDVCFGLYCDAPVAFHLNSTGEMVMSWYDLSPNGDRSTPPSARLEIFHDSFHLLPQLADVFKALAERNPLLAAGSEGLATPQAVTSRHNITPEEFCLLLDGLGFMDRTALNEKDGENFPGKKKKRRKRTKEGAESGQEGEGGVG